MSLSHNFRIGQSFAKNHSVALCYPWAKAQIIFMAYKDSLTT